MNTCSHHFNFIDAINAKYNASVPKVVVSGYEAVLLP
jgi:hypothetical protein